MRRRRVLLLVGAGLSLVLISIPLWRVTRSADCSGRGHIELQPRGGVPCDPRLYLPFGDLALGLVILGGAACLIIFASKSSPPRRRRRRLRFDDDD